MTKQEIALQLTIAYFEKTTDYKVEDRLPTNEYNLARAKYIATLYNTIFSNLKVEDSE